MKQHALVHAPLGLCTPRATCSQSCACSGACALELVRPGLHVLRAPCAFEFALHAELVVMLQRICYNFSRYDTTITEGLRD